MKPKWRRDLAPVWPLMRQTSGARLWLGAGLAVFSVAAGIALLALSGWFITATALAGLSAAVAFNVFLPSAGIRLLALGRTAGRYFERVVTHDATLAVLAALRERLFRGWARPEAARALAQRPARLLFRLTGDVDALESLYLRLLVPLAATVGAVALAGAVLAGIDLALAAAVVVWLLLAGAGVTAFVLRRARALALRRALALERLRGRAIDLVAGQTDLLMAGRLPAQCAAIGAADARLAGADRALHGLDVRAGWALAVAGHLLLAGVLVAGAALVERGTVTVPGAALALLLALAVLEPFGALRRGAIEAGRSLLAARRLAPHLRAGTGGPAPRPTANTNTNTNADADADADTAATDAPPPPPALVLSGVRVNYPGVARPVLDGIELCLQPGERVAVIGGSGAGKSTLLAVAAGELPAAAGQVRALPCTWLTQHTELFQDSLRDNLRLADPQADDARLWAVLGAAGLADDVRRLAQGLDTPLGEGGLGLSGGQARRLALARLLLRPSRLWLLDEATEGLDADTARDVLQRLDAHAAGRTLLITTHLRREAALAGRIVRLEQGRIVAQACRGTPGFAAELARLRPP